MPTADKTFPILSRRVVPSADHPLGLGGHDESGRLGRAMLGGQRLGGLAMDWNVGPVQDTADSHSNYSGSGFNILGKGGRPLLTLGYLSKEDGLAARDLIVRALQHAKFVGAPGA
jgi:hypothetical protein